MKSRLDMNERRIFCDRCVMLMINGVPCHETGCPNSGGRWDGQKWIRQRYCPTCGCRVDIDDHCCSEDVEGQPT